MDIEIDLKTPDKGLHALFKHAFITNCSLDDENITPEEAHTLEELDSQEVLENFKDLVNSLLTFKKQYKASDKAELVQRSEQFETLLQKLEAEVRNHIRIEHQLKLHIENNQNRIEELEKKEANDRGVIKELEERSKKNLKASDSEKVRKELEEKVRGLLEGIEKKEKAAHKMDFENMKLRTLLEEKVKECEALKKELVRVSKTAVRNRDLQGSPSIDYLRRKIQSDRFSQKVSDRSPNSSKENMRFNRKTLGESDLAKLTSPYSNREYFGTGRKEENKTSGKAVIGHHMRSTSDQKIQPSKRMLSR